MANNTMKEARKAKKLTLEDVAEHLGLSTSQISRFESGLRKPRLEDAKQMARLYGVSLAAIDPDLQDILPDPEPNAAFAPDTEPLPAGGGRRDVPVYGVAFGGTGKEADFSMNGEVLEYAARPALLVGRRRAFAVNVINDSMSPLYTSGKKVFVDPDGMRPKIGDVVLVELYADEPDAAGPGYIKTLVARGGAKLVLSQFNPPKELSFAADRVKTILRVIPYDELLGI